MKKKILSLLVALCLVFSSLPAVFAGEESGSVNIVVKNLNQKKKIHLLHSMRLTTIIQKEIQMTKYLYFSGPGLRRMSRLLNCRTTTA